METWEQWEARLAANRKRGIEQETDPVRKAERIQVDAMMGLNADFLRNLRHPVTNPATQAYLDCVQQNIAAAMSEGDGI